MKIVKETLFEMATPSREMKTKIWYHGTAKEYVNSIISYGKLKAPSPSRAYLSPIPGRIYLTSDIKEALGYAFYRNGYHFEYGKTHKDSTDNAYLVTIKGKDLEDVLPDEDIIADLIVKLTMKNSDLTEEQLEKFKDLIYIAKRVDPKLYHKYDVIGNYEYGTALGKKVIKYIGDDLKIDLINYGQKLSNNKEIKIHQVWEIPVKERDILLEYPMKYKEIGKQLI